MLGKRLLLRCRPNLTNYIRHLNEKTVNLVQYTWLKDNAPVVYNNNSNSNNNKAHRSSSSSSTNLYKDGSLEITHTSEHDAGSYKCTAKYRSITFSSQEAFVRIQTPAPAPAAAAAVHKNTTSTASTIDKRPAPRFLLWPEDRTLVEDDEAIFECLAYNDALLASAAEFNDTSNANTPSPPQYFKYTWLKDGVALDLKYSFFPPISF